MFALYFLANCEVPPTALTADIQQRCLRQPRHINLLASSLLGGLTDALSKRNLLDDSREACWRLLNRAADRVDFATNFRYNKAGARRR